jgi:hypothetical protein
VTLHTCVPASGPHTYTHHDRRVLHPHVATVGTGRVPHQKDWATRHRNHRAPKNFVASQLDFLIFHGVHCFHRRRITVEQPNTVAMGPGSKSSAISSHGRRTAALSRSPPPRGADRGARPRRGAPRLRSVFVSASTTNALRAFCAIAHTMATFRI